MNYLVIENKGSLPLEFIEILGAGEAVKEGGLRFFHTGAKYALAQAVRMGIKVMISTPDWKLWPGMLPQIVKKGSEDIEIRRMVYEYRLNGKGGVKTVKTGFTVDLGPNWNDPWYIVREFMMNALEQGGFAYTARWIDDINKVQYPSGKTIVYIQMTPEIEHVVHNMQQYVRLDGSGNIPTVRAALPRVGEKPIIFRRGFRVHVLEGDDALYDYELPNLEITEERKLSSFWELKWQILEFWKGVRDTGLLGELLKNMRNQKLIENQLSWENFVCMDSARDSFQSAWSVTYGPGALIARTPEEAKQAAKVGATTAPVPEENETVKPEMVSMLETAGIRTVSKAYGEDAGLQFIDPSEKGRDRIMLMREALGQLVENISDIPVRVFAHTQFTENLAMRLVNGANDERFIAINTAVLDNWDLSSLAKEFLDHVLQKIQRDYSGLAEAESRIQEAALAYVLPEESPITEATVLDGLLELPSGETGSEVVAHELPDRLLIYMQSGKIAVIPHGRGIHGFTKLATRQHNGRPVVSVSDILPDGTYRVNM